MLRLLLVSLIITALLAASCAGSSSRLPEDANHLIRYRLGSLLARVYAGRQADSSGSVFPFEVARRLHIVVDTPAQRLTLFVGDQPLKTYPVAVGRKEKPTPIGYWKIAEKDVWAEGFGVRWLGLNVPWGVYGIHGTNKPWSVGTRASAGCLRMLNSDVVQLYNLVWVGTPVTVKGPAFYRYGEIRRTIRRTHIGSDVAMLQRRLKELGFYEGAVDGKFGHLTEQAVRAYQEQEELEMTGIVDDKTYERLGLIPLEDDPGLRPDS